MKLTYRGVQYKEEKRNFSSSVIEARNKEIIYRGNSPRARINPEFPWIKYIKQLFLNSESRPVLDPITFWYDHKRNFIKDCWLTDDLEKLERAWNLTLQLERTKASKQKHKTKLKYRGVTYYR